MSKRLVICCDGTWNTPDQKAPTNVAKVALAIADKDHAGGEQRVLYHRGVGTNRGERLRGGAFGFGLSGNVRDAYRFLVQNFEPGDEIFLFGFSRGAYTARSTAGFIRNSGILRSAHIGRVDEAYSLYRSRASRTHPQSIEAELFRRSYSHETRIRFIGVWDTVGALGIPLSASRLINLFNRRWQFHDTRLSTTVDAAFHALAIDEKRRSFQPTLWQRPPDARDHDLEQVWFAGSHSDVGGGCPDPALAEIPLLWMADRARDCGLEFKPDAFALLTDDTEHLRRTGERVRPDALGTSHESRTGPFKLGRPMSRELGVTADGAEHLASSAVERHEKDSKYAPPNLEKYLDGSPRIMPVATVAARVAADVSR